MTKSASTTTALLMALFVQQTNSTNVSKYRMKTSRENKAMVRFHSALFFFHYGIFEIPVHFGFN
jgi:hypothetical protein